MDWIKKNYDRFTLAVLTVALGASAWVLWNNVSTFEDTFAAAKSEPTHDNKIVAVDTAKIDDAREHFLKPTVWQPRKGTGNDLLHGGLLFTSERYLLTKARQIEKPTSGALYSDSLTGKPIENTWFLNAGLPLLDPSVPFQDADGDGFLNEDEWRYSTNPNDKESHPAYETKLFLKQWLKQPFRFKFQAYDGDPKKDPEGKMMTFQINPLDAGGRTKFVNLDQEIEGTKFKVSKFQFKEQANAKTGDNDDVSELTLTNTETNDTVVLVLNKVIDSPTQFAQFEYFWGKKHGEAGLVFVVRKLQDFALQPKIDRKDLYKLLDVNEAGALIQRPDGEKYQVPPVPKK